MEPFREFLVQREFVESVLNEFNATAPSAQSSHQNKTWSAKKDEILQMWKNLRQDVPIIIQPLIDNPMGSDKSSYGEDGVRVTGSWNFITSVIGRLKDIMAFENPQTKLRLVLRAVDKDRSRPDHQSYVFYVNLEKREHGQAGRPTTQLTTQMPTA